MVVLSESAYFTVSNDRKRCIARLGQQHGRRECKGSDERCKRNGTFYLGSGRFICHQHSIYGFIPSDVGGDEEPVVDQVAERARRVLAS